MSKASSSPAWKRSTASPTRWISSAKRASWNAATASRAARRSDLLDIRAKGSTNPTGGRALTTPQTDQNNLNTADSLSQRSAVPEINGTSYEQAQRGCVFSPSAKDGDAARRSAGDRTDAAAGGCLATWAGQAPRTATA